jgi:RNA-directed DNA polymerase
MSLTLSASGRELRRQFFDLQTPQDVAQLLEIEYSRLIYHLYIVPLSKRYVTFDIAKKSSGVRKITAPATALKIIQQKLNQVLQNVYQPKPSVHGFIYGRSIVANAEAHSKRRKKYVFNIDLIDFFPSINFGRVRGMFMAIPYERNPDVATVLAQICCFNNELPQGAPTSPIISNMICAKMDSQLQRLAKKHRCTYTRYADDITFSTSLSTFPSALAQTNSLGQLEVGKELCRIIKGNGFEINLSKVRLQTRNGRQEVTGLTVNEFPNVRRKYVRQIRAMLHAWEKFGLENAEAEFLLRYDKKRRSPWKKSPSFALVVKGKIEFLGMVRGKDDPIYLRFRDQLRKLAPGLVKEPKDQGIDMKDADLMEWRLFLEKIFDLEEFRTLCFDLEVDYDSLRGEGKPAKIRELLAYLKRLDKLPELFQHPSVIERQSAISQ